MFQDQRDRALEAMEVSVGVIITEWKSAMDRLSNWEKLEWIYSFNTVQILRKVYKLQIQSEEF